jgi:hypothetical protein
MGAAGPVSGSVHAIALETGLKPARERSAGRPPSARSRRAATGGLGRRLAADKSRGRQREVAELERRQLLAHLEPRGGCQQLAVEPADDVVPGGESLAR